MNDNIDFDYKSIPKNYFKNNRVNYLARRDSIIDSNSYGSIYYTTDTSSKIYNWIKPNKKDLKRIDVSHYTNHINDSFGVETNNFSYNNLNKMWVSLYIFDNKYCLYAPSDWIANSSIIISDSLYYIAKSDGYCKVIMNYECVSKNSHWFKTIDYYGNINKLNIEIIDTINNIAIWSEIDKNNKLTYSSLKVASNNVKNFPFLVYDCGKNKCIFGNEGNYFEKPNFGLIRKMKESVSYNQK